MKKRIVVAFGGNAIDSGQGVSSAENQQEACKIATDSLLNLIKDGHEVMISHGNGPQVGALLLQHEASDSSKLPAMPLDTLVANTQGMIGYWMQNAMYNLLKKENIKKQVVTLVTQVLVDKNDPAFSSPTKFVGPFYQEAEAKQLEKEKGYKIKADSNRGFRRVVPSPKPSDILEKEIIQKNLQDGHLVIAVGGGGIPVIEDSKGHIKGVEAVIDKDLASCKLAQLIDADTLLVLTAVDHVCINFGKDNQSNLTNVSVAEIEQYIKEDQFPKGSMLPKVEAAIAFVKSKPGRVSIITSLELAQNALKDGVGTKIIN